jgi:hypothetical protein
LLIYDDLKKIKIVCFEVDFEGLKCYWMSQFLSMKLEAVNSRLNTGIEAFPPKDVSLKTSLDFYIESLVELFLLTMNLESN